MTTVPYMISQHPMPQPLQLWNTFEFTISTYAGDMDHCAKLVQHYDPKTTNISQIILEMLLVQNQFPSGRGGGRKMYDQTNYFWPEEYYNTNPEDEDLLQYHPITDGFFSWFGKIDQDGRLEQNYTINAVEIVWINFAGGRYKVKIVPPVGYIAAIKELNKKHRINNFDVWDDDVLPEDLKIFWDYRMDAIELVKKFLPAT